KKRPSSSELSWQKTPVKVALAEPRSVGSRSRFKCNGKKNPNGRPNRKPFEARRTEIRAAGVWARAGAKRRETGRNQAAAGGVSFSRCCSGRSRFECRSRL